MTARNGSSTSLPISEKRTRKRVVCKSGRKDFTPQAILTDDMFVQKAEYIHNNPVRRGLVDMPEHWVYSSASWFAGTGGVLEMDVME